MALVEDHSTVSAGSGSGGRRRKRYHKSHTTSDANMPLPSNPIRKRSFLLRRTGSVCSASSLTTISNATTKEENIVMDWSATVSERLTIPRTPQASNLHHRSQSWNGSPQRKDDDGLLWMDWVASGIEFFGCEGGTQNAPGRSVIGRALMLQPPPEKETSSASATAAAAATTTIALQHEEQLRRERDFCKLHEDFFEALLKEQVTQRATAAGGTPTHNPASWASAIPPTSTAGDGSGASPSSTNVPDLPYLYGDEQSSLGSLGSSVSSTSSHTHETFNSLSSTRTHKRRARPFRLSPGRRRAAKVSPLEAYDQMYNPDSKKRKNVNQVSLSQILQKQDLYEPSWYLHPNCVLQKDKGKGEPLGQAISANGRNACLDKLRDKMAIVVQVSSSSSAPSPEESTGMKRRPAKVAQRTSVLVETRSIIEVRLGFLSMQYGLLLHWDLNCHKIVFIALRKMCHDSFYTKIGQHHQHQQHHSAKTRERALKKATAVSTAVKLPLVLRSSMGNHAIYQRPLGTEVVLVDNPHRIDPPSELAPCQLSIQVHSLSGLASSINRYTLSMTFDNRTEYTPLQSSNQQVWSSGRKTPMTWQWHSRHVNSFEDLAGLHIGLLQNSQTISSMTLPLGEWVAQPCSQPTTTLQLTLPFPHDSTVQLRLELRYTSQYALWLYKELHARQVEETNELQLEDLDDDDVPDAASLSSNSTNASGVLSSPRKKRSSYYSSAWSSSSTSENALDWLCGVCFKEYFVA